MSLQAYISERVNLLRFAKLAPTFSNRAHQESKQFASRLGHRAFAFLASDTHASGRLGELRDKFHEHYDAVSASRYVASSVCHHPAFSLLFVPPLLVLFAISRFKLCRLRSRRRMLICRMIRGPPLLLTIWLDVAEMLRSTPLNLVTALAEIISEVRGALRVGVEALTDPTMLVQLPNCNDDLPADVGVLHYHGTRGSKLPLDAVVSGLFGVSSPPSPEVALRRVEKSKFEKYSEGVKSRTDIRFMPFAVTEFGTLGGHAKAFLTEVAKQATASKGMHLDKLLASWRRKVVFAVRVAHADNVLRGLSAATNGVEAASPSAGMPSPATALFTRAMGRKRPRASSRGA
jgi:hypothetical protein